MKNLFVSAAILVGYLVTGGTMRGQNIPEHAPDGGTTQRVQSIDIPTIANAPFSAVVVTEWTKILPDGSSALVKNHRTVARDSMGRVFEERRFFTPNGDKQETVLEQTNYKDPVLHQWIVCVPNRQVCSVYTYNWPTTVSLPKMPAAAQNGMKWEDLGKKTIDNVEVVGSQEVMTIPVGAIGNEKAQPVVKEFWYSPRLGINVTTKRFDPRASAVQNFYVTAINQGEPDAELFHLPAGYRMLDMDAQAGPGQNRMQGAVQKR
ncbi:MAG TPA: hypothetical protein VHW70_00650 [Edaphobacter sp.]|nr:hypothetical protein [Edaphobacter sp.]